MPATTANRPSTLHCSFCGRGEKAVAKLLAGPAVYICDTCVGDCNRILSEDRILDEDKESNASKG